MADDRDNVGARDRSEVARGEPYELDDFARRHGLSRDEVRQMVDRVGNDRAKLEAAVAEAGEGKSDAAAKTPRRGARAAAPRANLSTPRSTGTAGRRKAKTTKTAATKTAGETATSSTLAALAQPIAKAVSPVRGRTTAAARKVTATARRGSASARKTIAAAPRAVRREAGRAVAGARSAVTSRTATLIGAAAAGVVAGLAFNFGRKAVMQAPGALAGDWFEALKVEHRQALGLFDQLQATDDSAVSRRSLLLARLKHALSKHAITEENAVYPALREGGHSAEADTLNKEHGYVKQYLYDLENMAKNDSGFLTKIAAFRSDLEMHISEEEGSLFPALHARLDQAGNAKLTALANREGFKLA